MNKHSKIAAKTVLVALGTLGVSATALADQPHWARGKHYRDSDYARVVDVDPIIRRVRVRAPQRECWEETRAIPSGPSRTEVRATLVGGLIGAAAGHHAAAIHNVRDPAVIVGGSLIGAAIGNSIGAHKAERRGDYRDPVYQTVQRCEVTHRSAWEERIDGYLVTYVYQGRHYTTQMPYDPGRRIRVDVNVRPVHDRRF
jgi:uncharacterized protein YcfJ